MQRNVWTHQVPFVNIVLLFALIALLAGFTLRPEFDRVAGRPPVPGNAAGPRDARMLEIETRFNQAVAMLHARQYDFAVTALHRVLELSPRLVDAHVNMGYALLGLERYRAAADFFASAIELDHYQGNAYWGLAVALERSGDLEGALGAMRTYIHLAPPADPFVRKARAALWEWGDRLARGPRPEAEQQWLEQRGQQWEARNSPQVDMPGEDAAVDLLHQE